MNQPIPRLCFPTSSQTLPDPSSKWSLSSGIPGDYHYCTTTVPLLYYYHVLKCFSRKSATAVRASKTQKWKKNSEISLRGQISRLEKAARDDLQVEIKARLAQNPLHSSPTMEGCLNSPQGITGEQPLLNRARQYPMSPGALAGVTDYQKSHF